MFLTLFLVGAAGFLVMTFLSVGRIGGHTPAHSSSSGHSAYGHSASVHGGAQHGSASHSSAGHSSGAKVGGARAGSSAKASSSKSESSASTIAARLLGVLSPLAIFTYCLGFGATGLLIERTPYSHYTMYAAIAGALILNFLILRPLVNFLAQWQSNPSDGLEGSVAGEAEALSSFDPLGRGLVRLTLDGQLVQLLATLESEEHHRGVIVSKGDKVVILEVDANKNQCRVSRDLVSA